MMHMWAPLLQFYRPKYELIRTHWIPPSDSVRCERQHFVYNTGIDLHWNSHRLFSLNSEGLEKGPPRECVCVCLSVCVCQSALF